MAITPATDSRPQRRPLTVMTGVRPRRPRAGSWERSAGGACLVLEADVAPAGRPGPFTSAPVASFHTVTVCSSPAGAARPLL